MSKPMSKTGKRVLIALTIVALVGGCLGGVGIYAHGELTKPKFQLDDPKVVSAREVPKIESVNNGTEAAPLDENAVFDYIHDLYTAAIAADDVETSWHTDVKLKDYSESMTTPFDASDENVIRYILKQAGDQLKDNVYPKADGVLKSGENGVFQFDLSRAQVTGITAQQGRFNDRNEYIDDEFYYINFEVDPSWVDVGAIPGSETYKKFTEVLSPAMTVHDAKFETQSVRMSFKVARQYDELLSAEITRSYRVKASVSLQGDYAALAPDAAAPFEVETPYEATEKISFFYYGAHFNVKWLAVQPDDWQALPARVQVHTDEAQENFRLTYTVSDPKVISIDDDGVMRVEKKGVTDEEVTVGIRLEYKGHTYTDELTVYITTLEVQNDESR